MISPFYISLLSLSAHHTSTMSSPSLPMSFDVVYPSRQAYPAIAGFNLNVSQKIYPYVVKVEVRERVVFDVKMMQRLVEWICDKFRLRREEVQLAKCAKEVYVLVSESRHGKPRLHRGVPESVTARSPHRSSPPPPLSSLSDPLRSRTSPAWLPSGSYSSHPDLNTLRTSSSELDRFFLPDQLGQTSQCKCHNAF